MNEIDLQAIASRRIVYELPGDVTRQDLSYQASDGSTQPMAVYRPARATSLLPAITLVTGYPDPGFKRIFGRYAMDLGSNVSWAQLLAASGLAVVTYVNVQPATDASSAIGHVRENAEALGINPDRLGVWACSGNVPNALGLLMNRALDIKCAALLFGYMLDGDGISAVADNAKFGYVVPAAGRSVHDLPSDLPLLIVRAGRDEMPGLNQTIDAFVAHGLAANLAITVINHSSGPHAFDAVDRSAASTFAIRQVVMFFQHHLLAV